MNPLKLLVQGLVICSASFHVSGQRQSKYSPNPLIGTTGSKMTDVYQKSHMQTPAEAATNLRELVYQKSHMQTPAEAATNLRELVVEGWGDPKVKENLNYTKACGTYCRERPLPTELQRLSDEWCIPTPKDEIFGQATPCKPEEDKYRKRKKFVCKNYFDGPNVIEQKVSTTKVLTTIAGRFSMPMSDLIIQGSKIVIENIPELKIMLDFYLYRSYQIYALPIIYSFISKKIDQLQLRCGGILLKVINVCMIQSLGNYVYNYVIGLINPDSIDKNKENSDIVYVDICPFNFNKVNSNALKRLREKVSTNTNTQLTRWKSTVLGMIGEIKMALMQWKKVQDNEVKCLAGSLELGSKFKSEILRKKLQEQEECVEERIKNSWDFSNRPLLKQDLYEIISFYNMLPVITKKIEEERMRGRCII